MTLLHKIYQTSPFAGAHRARKGKRAGLNGLNFILTIIVFSCSTAESPNYLQGDSSEPVGESYVTIESGENRFPLAVAGQPAPLYASAEDHAGVLRAFNDLKADLGRVTGAEPQLYTDEAPQASEIVIAGGPRQESAH